MASRRKKSRDGFWRRLRFFLLENFEPFWRVVQIIPFLARPINSFMINTAASAANPRPHAFSTLSDFTSWSSLTDRTCFARQLPPSTKVDDLPDPSLVLALFKRSPGESRECPKSTLLFPIFAQYLTDGFLRTNMDDRTRTTSNHDIDLSPLYGRTRAQTDALREKNEAPGRRGRLKSQLINQEEYPPFLFEADGKTIRAEFLDAQGRPLLDTPLGISNIGDEGFQRQLFAVGGDRANSTALVSMINTLFLREHNALAAELETQNPDWTDEHVFQVARNILIVIYIKLVIEEYINHISSACFKLRVDPAIAAKANWNRPNWMTIEFALLYRWHSLVPDTISWAGQQINLGKMMLDNRFLTSVGLAEGFKSACKQNATAIGLYNTAPFLEDVEQRAILQARFNRVARYNDYRQSMGLPRTDSFDQMTSDPKRQAHLKALYATPDAVELYPALFAEDVNTNTPMPTLMGAMVALDAFSQALTNPLLSPQVFNERTFTAWGMNRIRKTNSIFHLLKRNTAGSTDLTPQSIRMTRRDWKRRWEPF